MVFEPGEEKRDAGQAPGYGDDRYPDTTVLTPFTEEFFDQSQVGIPYVGFGNTVRRVREPGVTRCSTV